MATNVEYQFSGKKLAIFTWHGCEIESNGKDIVAYIGHETPMQTHLNVHFALQSMRQKAKEDDVIGPRVLIVGPSDVGKSVLARTLCGYATRNFTNIVLCDIDPSGV